MNSKFFLLIFLLFQSLFSKAQNLIIDDSIVLKRGIYKNFKEFKYNNPSIQVDFSIEEKERRKFKVLGDQHYIEYKLTLKEEIEIRKDSIWGFCDGKDIYLQGETELIETNKYNKLYYLGRYCCYYEFIPGDPGIVSLPREARLIPKAININNGTLFYLDNISIKMILKKDAELMKELKMDKNFNKDYIYYIRKYCEKYNNEVKS